MDSAQVSLRQADTDHRVAVRVEGLWKRYGLPIVAALRRGRTRLCNAHRDPSVLDHNGEEPPWALKDINLDVYRGEILGVVGRNGAGKSTLLKTLAGVTPPTRGRVEVRGSVFPMIELNAGLHPELTGRENARLLGAIMGFSYRGIQAKMPQIEEFCELGEWFDRKVRKYSSGMLARLGFSVALQVDANVLLIDEILAVGDIAFRQKCVGWLSQQRQKDRTVLFVSHSLKQIERLCDRAVYLDQGVVRFAGGVKDTCSRYYESTNDEILRRMRTRWTAPAPIEGSDEMVVVGVRLLGAEGQEVDRVHHGSEFTALIELQVNTFVKAPHFTIVIADPDLNPVAHATTLGEARQRPDFYPGPAQVTCRFPELQLLKGAYTMDVGMVDHRAGYRIGGVTGAAQFQVIEPPDNYHMLAAGHFALPAEWCLTLPQTAPAPQMSAGVASVE